MDWKICRTVGVSLLVVASLFTGAARSAESHWTWLGWGGGGWFWASAADPKRGDVFYMGGDVNGIWKTEDCGRSWRFVNQGLTNYAVYSLTVAPSDGNWVYALTKNGVAVSSDGAAHWTMCAQTASGNLKILANRGGSIHALAVSPSDPRTVYAGGESGRVAKSVDGGANWSVLNLSSLNIAANDPVCTIAVSGANSSLVLLCHKSGGLSRSRDAGTTWTNVTGAPGKPRAVIWAGAYAPNTWYGAFDSNGVYVSRDDGLTWTALNPPSNGRPARDLACNPADPSVLHVVFTSGYSSHTATTRDGGATWTSVSRFTADHAANPTLPGNGSTGSLSGIQNISLNPANPDHLHLPGNWDPCISTDAGRSWVESCRGADISCLHDLRILDGAVYAAAMDEGSCWSADGGANWTALLPLRWKAGLSGHHWRILPQRLANGQTRIVSTVSPWDDSGIKYPVKVVWSEDGGKTFSEATGLPNYRPIANTMWGEGHGRALAADPSDPDRLYLGIDGDPENGKCGGGVFTSSDGGKSWSQLAHQPGSRRMFYGLAVDPTDANRIVWGACGTNSGVFVSNDKGGSWTKAQSLGDWIYDVAISPKGVIYATGNNLYRSDDHGRSFRTVSSFKSGVMMGVAVDPANEQRVWVAISSTDDNARGGIFETIDGCAHWTDISGDLPFRNPRQVRFDAASGQLWAIGNGAFKLDVGRSDGIRTWTGAVDGNWHNPANWLGGVPGAKDEALFPSDAPQDGGTVTVTAAVSVAKLTFDRSSAMTLAATGEGVLMLPADAEGAFTIDVKGGSVKLVVPSVKGEGLTRVVKTGLGTLDLAKANAIPAGLLSVVEGTVVQSVEYGTSGRVSVGGGAVAASFSVGNRKGTKIVPYVYTNGTFTAGDHVSNGPDDFHVYAGGSAKLGSTYGGKVCLQGGTMAITGRMHNGEWGQYLSALKSDTTAHLSGDMTAANYSNYTFPIKVENGAQPIDFVFTGKLLGGVPKCTVSGGGTWKTTGSWDLAANPVLTGTAWLMDNAGGSGGSGTGDLKVGEGATLGGIGVFGGRSVGQKLTVDGTASRPAVLAPGTIAADGSPVYGTFTVGTASTGATLTQGAQAKLRFRVNGTASDRLVVNGKLVLMPGTALEIVREGKDTEPAVITLATATGGIEGHFDKVTLPEGTNWRLRLLKGRLELITTPKIQPPILWIE